jgi:hypothetical protein
MKLLALFQKASAEAKKGEADDSGVLTEKDIAQLFNEVSNIKTKDPKQLPSA